MKGKALTSIALLACALIATAGAATTTAVPSTNKIFVDGEQANVAAYRINGNNYFKLRDLAAILSGTDVQFEVTWDRATGSITLTAGKAYTTVGGELGAIPAANQTAEDSTAVVYRDGVQVDYTGYNINDNNFYKLRDIAADFDFNVTWDGANQRVDILTTQGYNKPSRVELLPIDYLGMTMDELGERWGFTFTYLDYWYSGNAKGVYYDDLRVPMVFYYYDADFAGHAQGPEKIIMVSLGQSAYPQIREIAPSLPINATYADLLAKGYQTELVTDSDGISAENNATAYCDIELSGVRVNFYWFDYTDPYTAPADLIELFASI